MFVRHDLVDPVSLDHQGVDLKDPADRPLVRAFAAGIADLLGKQAGAFGTLARRHVLIESELFNSLQVDGVTFAQVLGNWYFNRPGPKVVIDQARP